MCSADITPIVWQWNSKLQRAQQRDDVVHTCRDFDRLRAWAIEHYWEGGEDGLRRLLDA